MRQAKTLPRRQALGAFTALGAATLTACGGGGNSASDAVALAVLAGLSLSVAGLTPAFSSGTTSYTLAVDNDVVSIRLTPTFLGGLSLLINGVEVSSGSSSGSIALAVGLNTVSLVVSAGSSSSTYTILVTRAAAAASNDATLSALTLSSGNLSPAFAAGTLAYTASVANSVASLTVTATTASSAATVRVNGTLVASGSASGAVALAVGSNSLTVQVTAGDGSTTRSYSLAVTRAAAGSCVVTPQETQGPYPLLAILSNTAMVRSDIREGKTGLPLRLTLTINDLSNGCTPVANAAVYIWHCDKDGLYSGYSGSGNAGQAGLTYLRGIQVTDSNGQVAFTTIYPGWYAGRITHIHVQIYLNDNLAVTATATTQMAFPLATTAEVYASALYTKGQNSSVTSYAADNVFSDGTSYEMLAISGNTSTGYDAALTITIA